MARTVWSLLKVRDWKSFIVDSTGIRNANEGFITVGSRVPRVVWRSVFKPLTSRSVWMTCALSPCSPAHPSDQRPGRHTHK